jgi:AcrR family transcriptional regulator
VAEINLESSRPGATTLIRNEPVQARSAARLTALLDAAARVVDEIGYERLTTAMVADRARASIGTVYRYFPDRIALLQSLAMRNVERTTDQVMAEVGASRHRDWGSALSAAYGVLTEAFRSEPGFASLRYGDVLDLRPAATESALQGLAGRLFEVLTNRFDLDAGDDARVTFEASVVMSDAIAAWAFASDPRGDEAYLRRGADATFALLAPHWGDPRGI